MSVCVLRGVYTGGQSALINPQMCALLQIPLELYLPRSRKDEVAAMLMNLWAKR